ncbi:S-adenosyl-L-methionine-dependent methyltransferase [Podospora australis]|uniref:S-adenosyl-L-methionine-dependent methyltransferase n=1 Tax=Podospora australis TaxID=1536484 RepID=A0AAN6WUI9_9PEZI|nr:S-adenosyl-L-methionine-dependent methyltransferase [Podospora australis]
MSTPPPATTSRFNEEAASWDSNPFVQAATTMAHKTYLSRLPPPETLSQYNILDLGCGTGLLTFLLAPSVRSVTAVDVSEGMIDVLNTKLNALPPPHNVLGVHALLSDPDDPILSFDPVTGDSFPQRRFDLVVSHLVLHHIPSLPPVFANIFGLLKEGGRVMVTDFEDFGPEARRFHPESKMEGVERHGIKRDEIRRILEEAGFKDVKVETAFEMEKAVETTPGSGETGGDLMTFPFLVCEGTK